MKTNYKLKIVTIIITLFSTIYSFAQAPVIQWQRSLGGTSIDNTSSIIQTTDGGFVIAGSSQSNNGDVNGNHGSDDFWIVKINSDGGVIEWQKSLGGTNIEYANSIIQTSDGGYIVAGSSTSNNGDVSGNHGSGDCWIVKLNSNGTIQWQKSLGGTSFDWATSIKQTTDGGYILAGNSQSNNGDVTGNHGYIDYWIVKITSLGIIQWQRCLGGTGDDRATSIIQTTDGGYVVSGYSESNNNGNVTGNHGIKDYWIVKLNSDGGVIEWQKSLGGTHVELAYSIKQTSDGGYIVAGHAFSSDGDVIGNDGGTDFWIVKLSSIGTIQWQKSLGGSQADLASSINQTIDGGYIITGASDSNDGDVTGHHGTQIPETSTLDYWVVKLNSTGTIQWQKSLGGTTDDYSSSIIQTTDGGYIIAGSSNSNDGDVTGNHGNYDYWIVKLAPDNLANNSFTDNKLIKLFPNPAKESITLKLNYFTPLQEITITDVLGKIIHNQKLEGLSTTINTSNFEKGIYFLNLVDGTQKTTKKFIVE